jgi:hypothetical protein
MNKNRCIYFGSYKPRAPVAFIDVVTETVRRHLFLNHRGIVWRNPLSRVEVCFPYSRRTYHLESGCLDRDCHSGHYLLGLYFSTVPSGDP